MLRFLVFSLILLAGQARAIDYEKCEAIQKIYTRIAQQQKQAASDAWDAKGRELCPFNIEAPAGEHLLCQVKSETFKQQDEAWLQAASSFQERLNKIKIDYRKSGCP